MFNLNKKIKNTLLIFIVILLIILPLSAPLSTHAWPVVDIPHTAVSIGKFLKDIVNWAWTKAQDVLKNAAPVITRRIMNEFTKAIVDWINSGFEGNPAFLTDTRKFFNTAADATVGDFLLRDPDLKFLCDPFKAKIKLTLGLQYSLSVASTTACSFTSAMGNITTAMNAFKRGGFIDGGGWDSWLKITTIPQNNQMGAMLLAQGALDAKLDTAEKDRKEELNWSGGFLSLNECEDSSGKKTYGSNSRDIPDEPLIPSVPSVPSSDYNPLSAEERAALGSVDTTPSKVIRDLNSARITSKKTCRTTTPGQVIANKIGWADTSDIRQVELADDLNAIFSALTGYVLNQVVEMGKGLLAGTEKRQKGGGMSATLKQLEDKGREIDQLALDIKKETDQQMQDEIQQSTDQLNNSLSNANSQYLRMSNTGPNAQKVPNWNTITGPIISNNNPPNGSGTTGGGTTGNDPNFTTVTNRDEGLQAIANQTGIEIAHLRYQDNLSVLLNATELIFATATCSTTLQTETINQIEGIAPYDKTITGNLIWNKNDIRLATTTINNNLMVLTTVRSAVETAANNQTVVSIVSSLADPQYLLSQSAVSARFKMAPPEPTPSGDIFLSIQNWVQTRINAYSATCPNNITMNKSSLSTWGIQ